MACITGTGFGALSLVLMQDSEALKLVKTLYLTGLGLSFDHFGEQGRGQRPEQVTGPGFGG